jgi:hypothetical protein
MKNIEDIIRNNRDLFEDKEPLKGHFERFNSLLEARLHAGGVKRSIVPYLLKAAVVTLLVTLSSLWVWDNFLSKQGTRMTLGEVSPQFREVENYYIHQVNLLENEINTVNISDDPEHKNMLTSEMRSMDSVYVQLQKELKANPNDERIISAMIEHYQTKLEVMSYIVNQLKSIRDERENINEDEKASI